MNIEQALNAADEGEAEGLRGLYPTAAQVLAAEVRDLRERHEQQVKMKNEQTAYAIALQRAIEAHCRDEVVGPFEDCPFHAQKLDNCLERHNAELRGASRLAGEASSGEAATSTDGLGAVRPGKD